MARTAQRIERGDWQTPAALARAVVARLVADGVRPAAVLEPTCGRGAFLVAAAEAWPEARLLGVELDADHAEAARSALREGGAARRAQPVEVRGLDAFEVDWDALYAELPEPLLVLGNPPWVTTAALGALGSAVQPERRAQAGRTGLEAMTGASNFDVSEWLLRRWLTAARGRRWALAMLCKRQVARRLLQFAAGHALPVRGALRGVDAAAHFGAQVDAVLLHMCSEAAPPVRWDWPVFAGLDGEDAGDVVSVVDGVLCRGTERFRATARYGGGSAPNWRSGLKHDCARAMELRREEGDGGNLLAADGTRLDLEGEGLVYPLLKGSDLANGRDAGERAVIVPQRRVGEDPAAALAVAPRTRAWLEANRDALAARKSSIYQRQPAFSVFGVGDYTFAPYKVAIAGLYKRLAFTLVGPVGGRPVVFDDTCYFLPFDDEASARRALTALRSVEAKAFFEARVFWDAKRPITKAVLQAFDWRAVGAAHSS